MSEGFEGRPITDAEFWAERWHWIVDALVNAGASTLDQDAYWEKRDELVRLGMSEPRAADLAFRFASIRIPSACEVNPW